MKTYLTAYLATGLAFLAIDAVWLKLMNSVLYQAELGPILLSEFKLVPASLFYMVYIFGIVFFAVAPALSANRWTTAAVQGAVLGFVAYATYDLTNQATLKNWSSLVTLADLCWGTFVTASAAVLGFLITRAVVRLTAG